MSRYTMVPYLRLLNAGKKNSCIEGLKRIDSYCLLQKSRVKIPIKTRILKKKTYVNTKIHQVCNIQVQKYLVNL